MYKIAAVLQRVLPAGTRYFVGTCPDLRTNSLLIIPKQDQENLLATLVQADFCTVQTDRGFLLFSFTEEALLDALRQPLPFANIAFHGEESMDNPAFLPVNLIRRTDALCRIHGTDTASMPKGDIARKLAVRTLLFPLLYADMTEDRRRKNITVLASELSLLLSEIRFSEKTEALRKLAVAKAAAGILSHLL